MLRFAINGVTDAAILLNFAINGVKNIVFSTIGLRNQELYHISYPITCKFKQWWAVRLPATIAGMSFFTTHK